jgi:hypothetical protein
LFTAVLSLMRERDGAGDTTRAGSAPPGPSATPQGLGESTMVINVGLYAACLLSLYVLKTTKPK